MSLSLISEAYFLDNDSENGGGNGDDDKWEEIVEQKVALVLSPEEVNMNQESNHLPPQETIYSESSLEEPGPSHDGDGNDEAGKNLGFEGSVIPLNGLDSDNDPDSTGASETTEVVNGEGENSNLSTRVATGASSSSDEYFSRVPCSRKKKRKRFGSWMWSYRKRQQGDYRLNTKGGKSKATSQLSEEVVNPGEGLNLRPSTSDSGAEENCPSPLRLSSAKRNAHLFKCPFCLETFSGRNPLIKHLEIHQASNSNGKDVTPTTKATSEHGRTENLAAMPTSAQLTNGPRTRRHGGIHSRNMKSARPDRFQCRICRIGFKRSDAFSDHMKVHKETNRPWKCPQCPSYFKSETQFRVHENRLHNRTPGPTRLPCKVCGKPFYPGYLSSHMKLHFKNGRSWNCPPCGFHFPSKLKLQNHVNLKHGEGIGQKSNSMSRPKLSQKFNSRSNHNNDHIGKAGQTAGNGIKKPTFYKCHICKIPCWNKQRLENHTTEIHQDGPNKNWKCLQCPSFFLRFCSLSRHENRVHGRKVGPFPCPSCERKFNQRSDLRRHLRIGHGYKQTTAVLELLQTSNMNRATHLSRWQHAMNQLRPCTLMLTRCDHLISKFASPTMATFTDPLIIRKARGWGRGRTKSNFRFEGGNKFKMVQIRRANDIPKGLAEDKDVSKYEINPIQEQSQIITGSTGHGLGIAEGENSVQPKRIYKCPYCFQPFMDPRLLIGHLAAHTPADGDPSAANPGGNGPHLSYMETTPTPVALSVKSTKQFQCNHCSYSSPAVQFLCNHMRLHSEEGRPFKCKLCGFNFTTFRSLRTHEGNYHKETKHLHQIAPLHKCQRCSYSNKSLSSLMHHMERHKDAGRPFKCFRCRYTFKSFPGLRIHEMRVHKLSKSSAVASARLRKCTECKYSTRILKEWKNHVAGHRKEKKPFKCSICSSYYHNLKELRTHTRRRHH